MAIHIVVDGYNLIGSDKGLRGDLEGKRKRLVEQLQQYRSLKGHPITLVFDGWRSGWPMEVTERCGGITVIYSQQGEKADNVIMRLARQMGSGCVVVSSDVEVRRASEASGAAAIYVGEFSAKLRSLDRGEMDDADGHDLDTPPPYTAGRQRKKGNPHRLSKIERRRRQRLKRL